MGFTVQESFSVIASMYGRRVDNCESKNGLCGALPVEMYMLVRDAVLLMVLLYILTKDL